MNNEEIKEILDYISSRTVDDILLPDYFQKIEDYITNLQKTQETLIKNDNEIITNLQEENEEIKIENEKLTQLWLNSQEKRRKARQYLDKFIPNEYGILLTERQWNYIKELLK